MRACPMTCGGARQSRRALPGIPRLDQARSPALGGDRARAGVRAVLHHPGLSDPRDDPALVLSLSSDAAEPAVHRPRQLLAAAGRRGVPHRADQHAAVLRDGGGHHAAARLRGRGAAALDREGRAGLRAAALHPGGDAVGAGLGDLEMDLRSDPRDPELRALVPRYRRSSPGCRTSTSSSTRSCSSRCGRCSAISSSCTASACATFRTSCWKPPSSTARRRGSG